jgi:hypothetical protein
MTRLCVALMFLIAIGLAGCGDPDHPEGLVGTWKVDPKEGSLPHQLLTQAPEDRKQFEKVIVEKMLFRLEANGKATFSGASGQWVADERELRILMGNPAPGGETQVAEHDFRYDLEEGGKALRTVSNGSEMLWRKQ